jgi:hypothetical protein
VSTLVLDAVATGGATLVEVERRLGPSIEPIVQLTALSAVVAAFGSSRAFALSMRPEMCRLRALGAANAPMVAFGALAITTALIPVSIVGSALSDLLTHAWISGYARIGGIVTPKPARSETLVVVFAVATTSILGWSSGLAAHRSAQRRGRTLRIRVAVAVAFLFSVPAPLAVLMAPQLTDVVRRTGGSDAAERLQVLSSADAPLVVMAAAAYGLVGASMVLAPDLARVVVVMVRRALGRSSLDALVGFRLAEARITQFGAIATLCVGAVGLITTSAMTAAAADHLGSGRAGASTDELGLTLGPSLLIAAAGSTGVALSQSRGTGSDLGRLARVGYARSGVVSVLLIAALSIGGSGTFIGLSAATGVWLVAIACGVDPSALALLEPAVLITTASVATLGCAVVFLGSEVSGAFLARRHRTPRSRRPSRGIRSGRSG